MRAYGLYVLAVTVVFICAITDLRYKKIYVWPVIIGGFIALFLRFFIVGEVAEGLGGCLIGAGCLLLGRLTNQSVGYGDGMVIMLLGFCLGFPKCFSVCLLCLFLISIIMVILLTMKKVTRKTTLPLMPWMLASLILGGFLW